MGDIGRNQKEYEYEPIEAPPDEHEEPEVSPAETPVPEPAFSGEARRLQNGQHASPEKVPA